MPRAAARVKSYKHPYYPDISMEKGRRADSPYWYARFKLADGREITRSTRTEDKSTAERAAITIRRNLDFKEKYNDALETAITFGGIAAEIMRELKVDFEKTREKSFQRHISILENHLLPFFKSIDIRDISHDVLHEYVQTYNRRSRKAPSKSTMRNHDYTLKKVFDRAVQLAFIKPHQIARLPLNNLEDGNPRCTFSPAEFSKLLSFMETWSYNGRKAVTRETRAILREYVVICGSTGIRPGTEMSQLTWKQVNSNYQLNDGRVVVVFTVGKSQGQREKDRYAIVYEGNTRMVQESLKRLRAINPDAGDSMMIFARRSDGRVPPDLHGAFEICLRDANLLYDPGGGKRSLYSLRHFYGTQMRLRGHDFERLAKQMGISIAMTERFYGHVTALMQVDALSGLVDLPIPNQSPCVSLTVDAAEAAVIHRGGVY
jgi:integrase